MPTCEIAAGWGAEPFTDTLAHRDARMKIVATAGGSSNTVKPDGVKDWARGVEATGPRPANSEIGRVVLLRPVQPERNPAIDRSFEINAPASTHLSELSGPFQA